jgi:carboxymethylenebutenolidase
VPFYGPLPDNANIGGSRSVAVPGIYGALDTRVTSTRDAAKAALDKAGAQNEPVTYDNADHAFFNDTGERFAPRPPRRRTRR